MGRSVFALALVLVAAQAAALPAQTEDWVEFAPPGGKCIVKMPTRPDDQVTPGEDRHGKYTTHLFLSQSKGAVYVLGWVDYTYHPDAQAEIEANRDNFLKALDARVTGERKISLLETLAESKGKKSLVHPGIEFSAEDATRVHRSRIYMVGDRPYQLSGTWAKGEDEPAGVALFFSSFRLVNPTSGGAPERAGSVPSRNTSAVQAEDDITGAYSAEGKTTKGAAYHADAFISKTGSSYTIRWVLNGTEFTGVGVRRGDYLAVAYEQSEHNSGVVLYHIAPKATLVGQFSTQEAGGHLGTETLTRVRP